MEALSSQIQKAATWQPWPLSPWQRLSVPAQNEGSIIQVWHEAEAEVERGQGLFPRHPFLPNCLFVGASVGASTMGFTPRASR